MDLFEAIETGKVDGTFLQGDVDLTVLNADGKSLLHVAMRKAKKTDWLLPAVRLLKKGINPDIKDSTGRTALEDVIALYLEDMRKFEASSPDKNSRVVYHDLISRTLRPLIKLIEEHKGEVPWDKARALGFRKGGFGCLGAAFLLGMGSVLQLVSWFV